MTFTYSYELEGSIEDKLNQIVQKIYGGKKAVLTANAQKQAKQLEDMGYGNCPICVAKTQYCSDRRSDEARRADRL